MSKKDVPKMFIAKYNNDELFNKDVKVTSKDGKLYYLP